MLFNFPLNDIEILTDARLSARPAKAATPLSEELPRSGVNLEGLVVDLQGF